MTPKKYTPVIGNRLFCRLALLLLSVFAFSSAHAQPEIGLNGYYSQPLGGMGDDVAFGGGVLIDMGKRLFINHSVAIRTGAFFYDLEAQTNDLGNFSHEKSGRLRMVPLYFNYTYTFRDEMAAGKLTPYVGLDLGAAFLRSQTTTLPYDANDALIDSATIVTSDYDVAFVMAPHVGLEYWFSQAWALQLEVRSDLIFAGDAEPDARDFRYEVDRLGSPGLSLGVGLGVKWAIWGSQGESFYEYKDRVKERRQARRNKGKLDNKDPLDNVTP